MTREVFAVKEPDDPGRVFYTIRPEDVGKGVIQTEIGPIVMINVIGRVMEIDIGKRLYRVPNDEGNYWYWQAENNEQRDRRLGVPRKPERRRRHASSPAP